MKHHTGLRTFGVPRRVDGCVDGCSCGVGEVRSGGLLPMPTEKPVTLVIMVARMAAAKRLGPRCPA